MALPGTQDIFVTLAILYVATTALRAVYNILLHPLANIPGPRVVLVTKWIETYYECFKAPGGQFMWAYARWHNRHGPIIRLAPNEVHIHDPTYYDTIYSTRPAYKLPELAHRFNNQMAIFPTVDPSHHRLRRSALNPYFSQHKTQQHAAYMQRHMDALCERVRKEWMGTGTILSLNRMWSAYAADVIVEHTLEQGYDFITYPDLRSPFPEAVTTLLEPIHFLTQFAFIAKPLLKLPEWLLALNPSIKPVVDFNAEMLRQIRHAKAVHAKGTPARVEKPRSVFMALLDSKLPAVELEEKRLQHEAIAIVGAGFDTTMYTMAVASFHLLDNPAVLAKLRAELAREIPDAAHMPRLERLYQLPYLTAVINEALRLSIGVSQRMPRVFKEDLVYVDKAAGKEYLLPAGTVVSMDSYMMHMDASVFPEPRAFRPQRWEGAALAPDGSPLSRYLVAFGKGSRACIGVTMATAILYIGLATFFRRFECRLRETTRDDVDVAMDRFLPMPRPGTLGVRVEVLGAL